ncbi:MAG: amino acid-binding protein [Rhodobiaceae bacterium]|nr:amino acid-binding protein [Rhodobiaceae bacterium]MCC0016098.1 amino acid-binding protein [Rhodobiaceae bacterium]
MGQQIILTIVASDRPGLVDVLSSAVEAHGGNWLASSMARLGGEFAGIVEVDVPEAQRQAFEAALAGLSAQGIEVSVRSESQPQGGQAGGHAAHLMLSGVDHPGIVHNVSHVLAEHGVSIDELHTRVFMGSMSGEALFEAQAEMVLPDGFDAGSLHEALEAIAGDLLVEISLKVD